MRDMVVSNILSPIVDWSRYRRDHEPETRRIRLCLSQPQLKSGNPRQPRPAETIYGGFGYAHSETSDTQMRNARDRRE